MFTWVGHLSLFKKIVVGYSKENIFFFFEIFKNTKFLRSFEHAGFYASFFCHVLVFIKIEVSFQ